MNAFRTITVLVFLLLTGCTIVGGNSIVTGIPRNPILADEVRIYRVAPESYEEIAMVSSHAGTEFQNNSSLVNSAIQRLKEEAAKLGANGVLLSNINERDTLTLTTNSGSVSGSNVTVNKGDPYTRMSGIAIYVP